MDRPWLSVTSAWLIAKGLGDEVGPAEAIPPRFAQDIGVITQEIVKDG